MRNTHSRPHAQRTLYLAGRTAPAADDRHVADSLQHAGAVHFYAPLGTLNVAIWKCDSAKNAAARRLLFTSGDNGKAGNWRPGNS